MSGEHVRSVVIVGGGVAAWMTAAALARALPPQRTEICVVSGSYAPAESYLQMSSLPSLRALHRILGIDERDFMRATSATFRLGTELINWRRAGERYMHPCGEIGASLESIAFHQHWLRLTESANTPLEEFSLSAVAAQLGRFSHPHPDPRTVLSTLSYGYHLDASRYGAYLRRHAELRGARCIEGEITGVRLRAADGFIEAVVLRDGRFIEGDLFIDCSGLQARLIEQELQTGYEDWAQWLPCNRAVALSFAPESDLSPYMRVRADAAGWHWRVPLQDRVCAGYVYCNRYTSDDAAAATLLSSAKERALEPPSLVHVPSGRRKQAWNRNCVAIGEAACVLDPLESTSLHLIQSGVARLLGLFPHRDAMDCERREYNRLAASESERARDFLILHYHLTARADSALWESCRTMSIPETLARKVRLFAGRGRIVSYDEETFGDSSWLAVMIGQGVRPVRADVVAQGVPLARIEAQMQRMRETIRRAAESLPPHRVFIERYCAAGR